MLAAGASCSVTALPQDGSSILLAPNGVLSPNVSWSADSSDAGSSLTSLEASSERNVPIAQHLFTADPSAHVFNDQLWVYTSHDRNEHECATSGADCFNMTDYRSFSFLDASSSARDEGVALSLEDVPWARRQMWAPDVVSDANGYHLFFPAKDAKDVFRIGHARADSPYGPFVADEQPLHGSLSIDPAVFVEDDGLATLYFGGLQGGQLELVRDKAGGDADAPLDPSRCALAPLVAPLTRDKRSFSSAPRMLRILDADGDCLREDDEERRFFEGAWLHRLDSTYFLSYSTGTTHRLVYATSSSRFGPFTYRGLLLPPVAGWTTHHSIVQWRERWWLLHHDSTLSGGDDYRRCVKAAELRYVSNNTILPVVHGKAADSYAQGMALLKQETAKEAKRSAGKRGTANGSAMPRRGTSVPEPGEERAGGGAAVLVAADDPRLAR